MGWQGSKMVSIVVPVYRSAQSLEELYERIEKTFRQLGEEFELILVEDAGGDDSWEVMKALRKRDPRVRIVRLMRNYGQHNALMCGFSFVKGKYAVTIDDDLQNPPEEIPKLIQAMETSSKDVIFGLPRNRAHPAIRNLGSFLFFRLVALIFGQNRNFRLSNFRIIKKQVIDQLVRSKTPNPGVGLLILGVTNRIDTVVVKHHRRKHGNTNYTRIKLIRQFLNGILYHSYLPLKVVSHLGIGCLVFSALLSVYYFVQYFFGSIKVTGWMTLVLLVLFFSGTIMFSLGIIGEYLLRILQEVRQTPQYVIRDSEP